MRNRSLTVLSPHAPPGCYTGKSHLVHACPVALRMFTFPLLPPPAALGVSMYAFEPLNSFSHPLLISIRGRCTCTGSTRRTSSTAYGSRYARRSPLARASPRTQRRRPSPLLLFFSGWPLSAPRCRWPGTSCSPSPSSGSSARAAPGSIGACGCPEIRRE